MEEMATTVAKDEDDKKKERARPISIITNNTSQKRKTSLRNPNDNRPFF